MKAGVLVELHNFFLEYNENQISYRKIVDFLLNLKNKYYNYLSLEEIYKKVFKTSSNPHKYLTDKELLELIKVLKEEINEGKMDRIKMYEELLEELENRETFEKNKHNFEIILFKILLYLNRVSNITFTDLLQLDIKTIEELLKDDELRRFIEQSQNFSF